MCVGWISGCAEKERVNEGVHEVALHHCRAARDGDDAQDEEHLPLNAREIRLNVRDA
jgi:hypothetical protein